MNVTQIIEVMEKRITYLQTLKQAAFTEGNLDLYNQYDLELNETQNSLAQLKTLG